MRVQRSAYCDPNPRTVTEETRGKLGQNFWRGDGKDAQEGGHSEEQLVAALRQVEAGALVEEVCLKAGDQGSDLLPVDAAVFGCRS
jgi:hypothetical protein